MVYVCDDLVWIHVIYVQIYVHIYRAWVCVSSVCVCVGVPALHVQDHLVHIQSQRSLAGFWPTKYRSGCFHTCGSNATLKNKLKKEEFLRPESLHQFVVLLWSSIVFLYLQFNLYIVHNNLLRYIVFRYPTRASSRGATARSRDRRKLRRLSEMHGKANLGWCFMVLPIVSLRVSWFFRKSTLDQRPKLKAATIRLHPFFAPKLH